MSKRDGGSIRRSNPKVRKRNGVKIRTVMVPESDEEDPPSNVNTDYARLVQTRVTPSGKIGSITTSSIPLLETDDTADNVLLEPVDTDCIGETAVEDMPTIPTTQKKRKKANDSTKMQSWLDIRSTVLDEIISLNGPGAAAAAQSL